ncbi:MAG TPA: DUF262 domain-containing protein, partial [Oscillatoriales cyanobacterium M59_W2019_021]|nr:DUF262 domain-containing protein [Oscillatoriales cyanobacterium M59_W2019_021]
MATLESQDLSIGKLFNEFYIVPSYQREYVWKKEQVTEFFDDIYNEFTTSQGDTPSEYFIGSIIVCDRPNGLLEVIDGQQRITTAYLLLCAIRDYLKSIKPTESIELLNRQIASTDIDEEGNDVSRYRVTLQYEDSGGVLERIASCQSDADIPSTASSTNIRNAYKNILKSLESEFGQQESAISDIRKFYTYFNKNVILVRVKTATRADALKVFATINNRGVSLDDIDLVKNLMFMEASKKDYDILKKDWKAMVDLLFKNKEKPMRFIRYFILSQYETYGQLKGDIYAWFFKEENEKFYKKNPTLFVSNLLDSSQAYIRFLSGQSKDKSFNRYLANLRYVSPTARMPFMLLIAGQKLPKNLFLDLSQQVENIFFAYLLVRESTGKFEPRFAQWCLMIRNIKNDRDFKNFVENDLGEAKRQVSNRFKLAFANMEESSVQKTLLRYILSKFAQYIDELAFGSTPATIDLKSYINKKVEIEHILPQKYTSEIEAAFDKPKEISKYIKRLGNLTLVEKAINTSVGNKPFDEKKKVYPQSKLLLTRSIAERVQVGQNTAIDRAVKDLETFETWTSESIERRQKFLTQLAHKVW